MSSSRSQRPQRPRQHASLSGRTDLSTESLSILQINIKGLTITSWTSSNKLPSKTRQGEQHHPKLPGFTQEQGNRRPSPRNTQGEQRHPKATWLHSRRQHIEQTSRPGNFRPRWHALDTSQSMRRRHRSRVDRHQGAGDNRSERLQATTKQTGTSLAAIRLSPCCVCRRLQLLAHWLGVQDHQPRWWVPGRMVVIGWRRASVRPEGAPLIHLQALEHRDQPKLGLRQNHRARATPCTARPGQVPLLSTSPVIDHNTITHPLDKGKNQSGGGTSARPTGRTSLLMSTTKPKPCQSPLSLTSMKRTRPTAGSCRMPPRNTSCGKSERTMSPAGTKNATSYMPTTKRRATLREPELTPTSWPGSTPNKEKGGLRQSNQSPSPTPADERGRPSTSWLARPPNQRRAP